MYRATIRYSIDGESSSRTNRAVKKQLQDDGFLPAGTATHELETPSLGAAIGALKGALDTIVDAPGGGALDHVWIYISQVVE